MIAETASIRRACYCLNSALAQRGAGEQNLFTAQPWWVPSKPGITVLIGTIAAVWLAPGRSSHVCIASNLLWAFVMSCLALIDEQARLCGSCSYMS